MSAPSLGINKSLMTQWLQSGCDNPICLRQGGILHVAGGGEWDFGCADGGDGTVKIVECALHDSGADFGSQTTGSPAFIDDHRAMRLSNGSKHSRHVERPQRSQIDDFCLKSPLGKLVRSCQCFGK
jgi:hypothetical protein